MTKQEKLDSFKLTVVFANNNLQITSLGDIFYYCARRRHNTTYKEQLNKLQCDGNCCRSTDDIYRIAKGYGIKNISFEDVKKAYDLLKLKNIISTHFCTVIGKSVIGGMYNYTININTFNKYLNENNLNKNN